MTSHLIPIEKLQLAPQEEGVAVLLSGNFPKVIPIMIGTVEAQSLYFSIQGLKFPRSSVYGLIIKLIKHFNGDIQQLVIHTLKEEIFYAYLMISTPAQPIMLDCRPSDGMVLARRCSAPIFITPELLKQAGQDIALA